MNTENIKLQKSPIGGYKWSIRLSKNLTDGEVNNFLESLFSKKYFRGSVSVNGIISDITIPIENISDIISNDW